MEGQWLLFNQIAFGLHQEVNFGFIFFSWELLNLT